MAKFDLTDTNNPKVWSPDAQDFVLCKDKYSTTTVLPFSGTDALGDYNKSVKGYTAHTSGAKREKMGNPRYDLMPARIVNDAYGRVAEFGMVKYSARNWEKGLPASQIAASLQRHLWAYMDGENKDTESGLSHLDHLLWNVVALLYNNHHGIEDDRITAVKH